MDIRNETRSVGTLCPRVSQDPTPDLLGRFLGPAPAECIGRNDPRASERGLRKRKNFETVNGCKEQRLSTLSFLLSLFLLLHLNTLTFHWTYDSAGRVIEGWNAAVTSPKTLYVYDSQGNLAQFTDAAGKVTKLTYDVLGRRTGQELPGGAVREWTYDKNGNLLTEKDAAADTTTHTLLTDHEVFGWRGTTSLPPSEGGSVTYEYDNAGNVTKVSDSAAAGEATLAYDALDRPTSVTDARGRSVALAYDKAGNRTSVTDPNSVKTIYAFDNLNRVTGVTHGEGAGAQDVATYTWLDAQRVSEITRPSNSTQTTYDYDTAGRLIKLTHGSTGSPQAQLAAVSYTYHPGAMDLKSSQLEEGPAGPEFTSYSYDAAGRLSNWKRYAGSAATGPYEQQTTLTYDAVGNRITETIDTESVMEPGTYETRTRTYTHDDRHRLTAVTDSALGIISYSWDAEGRLTGRTLAGTTRDFEWDSRDRLTGVTEDSSVIASYDYGESGLKLSSSWPGTPLADREYAWEGRELLAEYEGTSGELRARIIRGHFGLSLFLDQRT